MILPILFLSSIPLILAATDATTCAGKPNACFDQVKDCATIFPQTAGAPSPNCFIAAYAEFFNLCHKTCLSCCIEPCVDVNPRCSSWNDRFCTNPFYCDQFKWENCRKKCNMC
ncbi:hypothetical protein PRIPAC_79120 [Pristionchus pacificus]|uniref:ShK domain-containing protein n=1 Tax=Pristionchus pacificus TaxID=54126 RepID=A0A454Y4T4_PRIPA|nr:hypothetical protein PRIPAC_79120 [Pristionchus pacificus]|eukprot:PDM78199.1 ShK domain-containing protein [Pristionchus pacificus]